MKQMKQKKADAQWAKLINGIAYDTNAGIARSILRDKKGKAIRALYIVSDDQTIETIETLLESIEAT